jgi:hypothetical protein
VNHEFKIYFCAKFLVRILDHNSDAIKGYLSIEYLKDKSICFGLRILRYYPRRSAEVIIELLLFELVCNQGFTKKDLLLFYDYLFANLFFGSNSSSKSQSNSLC